jgi:tetratricopeptide (TPR) repeat protein
VALVIVAIVAAHPVRRFDEFRQLPPSGTAANFTSAHLTSGSSSGRWQFWTAAVDEWRSAPLAGRGAGSYQSWWAQHASFTYFLKNAHSLYLEVLAEEGLIGVLLLVAAIVVGLLAGVRRARSAVGREREIAAAVLAVAVAFFVTAGIDWTWQLTVVSVVGIVALGLSAASPTGASATRRGPFSLHTAVIAGGLAIAWAILIAQAIPWLASSRLGASQSAAAKGQLSGARKDALDAKAIEPWASSPYLQLALVDELRRDYASARRRIHQAIRRDEDDWAVWFVASRIDREAGRHAAAAADYARARSLNPRSPVFASEGAPK